MNHCQATYNAELAFQQELESLCDNLRQLPEIEAKRSIKIAAAHAYDKTNQASQLDSNADSVSNENALANLEELYGLPGDDCAAFSTGDGYQLLAMEGMLPNFVQQDPRAAGWSSVMANVSDIAAMGGRPTAIANAFWHNDTTQSEELIFHIKRACKAFGVKFSGGHSSINPSMQPNLAVAITGYAKKLLSCYHIKPEHKLFMLTDLTGSWHGDLPYWGCVQGKTNEQLQTQWRIPADLAEKDLAVAAKDISNGGILGTLIMMIELTKCGVTINLEDIPAPDKQQNIRWLRAFQSFGFLLAVPANKVSELNQYFSDSHLTCAEVGTFNNSGKINIQTPNATAEFWDIKQEQLTNMGNAPSLRSNLCQQ
ncbi:sll0787 family AIR synthase-like protein [Paraglaciecola sp. L3A3]|uniref:sll0787 family AIR synthase-like protein n=1 Tax=Paraglaciecola sp. L3A3 TaxID=2686358 RepID=UPI00131C8745|nr:sll0787 family AIR synthase-like protein [Paraglaciecola sp. L3A3]